MGKRFYHDFWELPEVGSNPATPASGFARIFAKGAGFFSITDTGEIHQISYAVLRMNNGIRGTVAVGVGKSRFYLAGGGNFTFDSMRISVDTAPTGSALTVDVNLNGTTIYTTQSARPSLAAGDHSAVGNNPAVTSFASGDYFTFDVDTVGSTVAGADLMCCLRVRKTV